MIRSHDDHNNDNVRMEVDEEVELKRQRRLKRMKIRSERRKQKKRQQQQSSYEWPKHSSMSLPSLPSMAIAAIEERNCQFATNEECTSITLPPSGRHVIAGFCDGTLRLYDVTGRLLKNNLNSNHNNHDDNDDHDDFSLFGDTHSSSESETEEDPEMKELFDCDSSDEEENTVKKKKKEKKTKKAKKMVQKKKKQGRNQIVMSKCHQNYGAVACQIQAKGVITSLLMDVVCAQDSLFCFGGVLRGSTELVAVDLSGVERYHDGMENVHLRRSTSQNHCHDILDMIKVYRYSDAKLKGFGACTRLQNCQNSRQEYRLFTGKGIKNIHIWSFVPPQEGVKEPIWQCLYDTPTNGNTITQLSFRHDSNGLLQGISKSDDQKLRIWDLSFEQGLHHTKKSVITQLAKRTQVELPTTSSSRPKRPPYIDIINTENTLGVFGPYTFSGGAGMYNQMSVMCLDVEDVQSPFNHTELAFPGENNDDTEDHKARRSSRSKRQQRGELKSIINVTGLTQDAAHVILELSNGSVCHYSQNDKKLDVLDPSLYVSKQNVEENASAQSTRKMCIARIGAQGKVVLATTFYDNGKGFIILRSLPSSSTNNKPMKGFWGFHGLRFPPLIRENCLSTPSSSSQSEDSFSSNDVIATMSSPDHSPTMSKTVSSPPSQKNESRIVVASSPDSKTTSIPENGNTNDFPSTPPHKSPLPFNKNEIPYAPMGVAVSPERVDTSPPKESTSKSMTDQEAQINGTIMKFLTKTNVENKKTKKSSMAPSKSENTVTSNSLSNMTKEKKKVHTEPNKNNDEYHPSQHSTTDIATKAKVSENSPSSKDKDKNSSMSKNNNISRPETNQKLKQNPSLRIQVTKRKINEITNSVSVDKDMVRLDPKKNQSGLITQEDSLKRKKLQKVEKSFHENNTLRKTAIPSGKVVGGSREDEPKSSLSKSESDGSSNVMTDINEKFSESNTKVAMCHKEKKKRKKILAGSVTNIPNGSNTVSAVSKKAKSLSSNSGTDFDKSSSAKKDNNVAPSLTKVVENQKKKKKRIDRTMGEPDKVKKTNNRSESNHISKSSSSKNETKNINERTKVDDKDDSVFPFSHKNQSESQTLDDQGSSAKTNDSLKEKSNILRVATALVNLQNDNDKPSLKRKPENMSLPPRTPTRTDLSQNHTKAPKKFRMKKKASLTDLLYLKNRRPTFTDLIQYSCDTNSSVSNTPVKESSVQTRDDLIKLQDAARRKMALHHRSAHEQVRRKVLSCADRVVNMYPSFDTSMPSPPIEAAKVWLNESLWIHEQSLQDLMDIQKMEAVSLAACQTAEAGGKKAPVVQVSFPFPKVFSQTRQKAFNFLEECATKI